VKTYSVTLRCDSADIDENETHALRTRVETMSGIELQSADLANGKVRLLVEADSPERAVERGVEAAERFVSEEADWQADDPLEVLD
jgi:hypothetical protein